MFGGSLGLNFEYDGGPIIEIWGPIFSYKLRIWKAVHPSVKARCGVPRSVILRAMFGVFQFFGGPFEIFEGHILPSVKHNPIRFFLQKLNLSL